MNNIDFLLLFNPSLKIFNKAPVLTVRDAAFLSAGFNPLDYPEGVHPQKAKPSSVDVMLLILANAINAGDLQANIMRSVDVKEFGTGIRISEDDAYFYEPLYDGSPVNFVLHKHPNWSQTTVKTEDLKLWLSNNGLADSPIFFGATANTAQHVDTLTSKDHISENLAILNKAAHKFWANADKDDKETHPKKQDVIDWLKLQGFSKISAEQGAVIIRPEWAAIGRPPEK